MTDASVQKWLRKEPFEPFVIRTSNGETYQVRHPENAMMWKTNIHVGDPETDRYAELALLHVASVEKLPSSQSMTE